MSSTRKRIAEVQLSAPNAKRSRTTPREIVDLTVDMMQLDISDRPELMDALLIAMQNNFDCATKLPSVCHATAAVSRTHGYVKRSDPAWNYSNFSNWIKPDGKFVKRLENETFRGPKTTLTINMPDPENNYMAIGNIHTFDSVSDSQSK